MRCFIDQLLSGPNKFFWFAESLSNIDEFLLEYSLIIAYDSYWNKNNNH